MIHLAWPWLALLLPLPLLLRRLLAPATPGGAALYLPFAAGVAIQALPASAHATRWRGVLFTLVWLLLVGAAMRPQWLGEPVAVPSTGRRLMLAVDVSGSMATEDMAEGATRLRVVQEVASNFIRQRRGDQLGLILFGTRPYLQAPLTTDLNTVAQFLRESMVGVAGPQTAIGDAIGLALKRLNAINAQGDSKGQMALILMTDGGNNAGLMAPVEAAKVAAAAGLRIYTIGVGAAAQNDKSDTPGNLDLDETTLKEIARITGGEYFRATDVSALQGVYAKIDKLEPGVGNTQWDRPSSEWFHWPLELALLLSVPAVLMRERT